MRFLLSPLKRHWRAFTLVELLTVMAVIAILAGLVLSLAGYANTKAARGRAAGEIQALENALESFHSDHGTYPHQDLATPLTTGSIPSDGLDPRTNGVSLNYPASNPYINSSLELYEALSGDISLSGTGGGPGSPNYISDLRQDVYGRPSPNAPVSGTNQVQYLSDPWGNVYGYSTANATVTGSAAQSGQAAPSPVPGFNPTYDLWSTGGNVQSLPSGQTSYGTGQTGDPALVWIKNW